MLMSSNDNNKDEKPPDQDSQAQPIDAKARNRRGKLKIFLGYATGVGKTFTMLEAAQDIQKETDIVIAYIETHGYSETEALLKGLEILPRRQSESGGAKLTEMDLDAVLKRHPSLALVDDLAHENTPDSRHPQRYLDIEELLEAGIDVYTTLNVQNIESTRDIVAQITGIWTRETVPDSFVDKADEIEVVDLPPSELIKRTAESKVYIPAQFAVARENLFRVGILASLRELAMRTAAKHIGDQAAAYMKAQAPASPLQTGERLLVCLIPGYFGTRFLRSARRLANELGAEWTALYVETSESSSFSREQQSQIENNLRLAERMGAKTEIVQAKSIPSAIIDYARSNNVTKIVLGKAQRSWRRRFSGSSVIGQIIRRGEQFDIFIAGGSAEPAPGGILQRELAVLSQIPGTWRNYFKSLGLVVVATLLGGLIYHIASPTTVVMLYLLCTVISAYFWGPGPSTMVSVIGVLLFDFFYVPPFHSFKLTDTQYFFTLLSLLGVGFVVSYLSSRIRGQTEFIKQRERQTLALYALGKDLALASNLDSYVHAIITRARETFNRDTVIFLPRPDKVTLRPYTNGKDIPIGDNETAAAVWSFERQKIVGHGTDTLPNARARFLPLITSRGTVGVIAFMVSEPAVELSVEQLRLLEAFADLAALALESILGKEQMRNA